MKIINHYILLLNVLLLFTITSKAQIDFKKYLNDSTKYDLVLSRINGDERNDLSELILKANLEPSIKNLFFNLPSKEKLFLLLDSTTSWATNLLLYEKYREDPHLYLNVVKNKNDWDKESVIKKADIAYWTKFLKKQHK